MNTTDAVHPAIALALGVVTALATVVVALVNKRKTQVDERDRLERDIKLAKKLQDGSRDKQILERAISSRLERLIVQEHPSTQGLRWQLLLTFAVAEVFAVTGLALAINDFTHITMTTRFVEGASLVFVFVFTIIFLMNALAYKAHWREAVQALLEEFPVEGRPTPRPLAAWQQVVAGIYHSMVSLAPYSSSASHSQPTQTPTPPTPPIDG